MTCSRESLTDLFLPSAPVNVDDDEYDFDDDDDDDDDSSSGSSPAGSRPALSAAAEAAGLGKFIRVHNYRKRGRLNFLIYTAGCIFLGALGPGFATLRPEEVPAIAWIGGPIFGIAALYCLFRFITAGRIACQIHEGGMVLSTSTGAVTPMSWQNISAIRFDIVHHTGESTDMYRGTIELRLDDNRQVKIPVELENAIGVVNRVMKYTGARLYEAAMNTIQSGGTDSFGAVTVDKEGVTMGSKRYPWSEAHLIDDDSKIILRVRRGKKKDVASVNRTKVENWHVLEQISDNLNGGPVDDDDDDDDDDWDDDDD